MGENDTYKLSNVAAHAEFKLESDGHGGTDLILTAIPYTAPPDRTGFVVNSGYVLDVNSGGKATSTIIHSGGVVNVLSGGLSELTTINGGGVENVYNGGRAIGENLNGGVENVLSGGVADNVRFGDVNHSTLKLASPSGLMGAISNWRVGDVIDFLNTSVTGVHQTGDVLTMSYGDQKASYQLAGQQANTEFKLESDGHGGTELVLTHIVGVQQLHGEAAHHMLL